MRNKQLHGLKFFRQYSIGLYILDFYCPLLKIAVELDGEVLGYADDVLSALKQKVAFIKARREKTDLD
ncbi:MAG: endonuclease domain-containing protein [Thermodesulfobacteriota bacterium]